jgi:DHA2 family multidrug resistance protein
MADATAPDRPAVHPWLISLSVLAGTFMVVLDTTVVNVSLPNIAGNLSATIEETTWALTTYLAANAVILPITGWLARHFGRKRLLLLSVTLFTVASFLCGLSPSLPFLILCRIVQGATGGVMQPISQAVMLETFPPRERGKAMAIWGIGIVVAPIIGPVLGGWLTDTYSWRWVFYINIPIGILSVVMIRAFIFDPPYLTRDSARADYLGISLLAIGVASLQIGLDQGQKEDWFSSYWITGLLVTAAIVLTVFIVYALKARRPVVDLRVFKESTYAMGVVLITLMGFVMFGGLILMPVLLQTLMGYSPLKAGIAMAPRGLGSLVMMPLVGVLMAKGADPRKVLGTGFVLGGFTFYWLSWLNLEAGFWNLFWPQFFQGVGFGMLFVPLTTISMDRIAKAEMGNATSLFNLLRNIGGSTGIAIVETILARDRQVHTNNLISHIDPYNPGVQNMLRGLQSTFAARGSDLTTAADRARAVLWGLVQQQAAMIAFIDAFKLLGFLFLVTVPLVFFMKRPEYLRRGGGAPAE